MDFYPCTAEFWQGKFQELFHCAYDARAFNGTFGVTPDICSWLWALLGPVHGDHYVRPIHLLIFLCFIKTYDTYTGIATRLRVTEKTVRTWVWRMSDLLSQVLKEVNLLFKNVLVWRMFKKKKKKKKKKKIKKQKIHFNERTQAPPIDIPGYEVYLAVDTTFCQIYVPQGKRLNSEYYSVKHSSHGVKYEIGVSTEGKTYWLAGPYLGSKHDLTIFNSSLSKHLSPGEKVIGDKAYSGSTQVIKPFKGKNLDQNKKLFNNALDSRRAIVENVNAWLKNFKALRDSWRHPITKHFQIFYIIACLVNLKKKQ